MSASNKGTRGRRKPAPTRRRTANWLHEQLEKQKPGWHPVLEMVELHDKLKKPKAKMSQAERERFPILCEIAKYVAPKLKSVELLPPEGEGGSGELTIRWKS